MVIFDLESHLARTASSDLAHHHKDEDMVWPNSLGLLREGRGREDVAPRMSISSMA